MSELEQQREKAAEEAFVEVTEYLDLKDSGGFFCDGDEWTCKLYLENGDEPSIRETLVVRFAPGSAVVTDAYISG